MKSEPDEARPSALANTIASLSDTNIKGRQTSDADQTISENVNASITVNPGESSQLNCPSPSSHHSPFAISDAPRNLPFIKFREGCLSSNPSTCHVEPSHIHELAWSVWKDLDDEQRRHWTKIAWQHVLKLPHIEKSREWYDHAFDSEKPEEPYNRHESEDVTQRQLDNQEAHLPHFDSAALEVNNDIPVQPLKNFQLKDLLSNADISVLERSVEKGREYLNDLKTALEEISGDTALWVNQIEKLQESVEPTQIRTIIGVVGNTGAGKSSVINAILDEERIVPTSTVRACTSVITELSYNYGKSQYRAEIEFLSVDEWNQELQALFGDLLDNGKLSRECGSESTNAGVAYATVKAVYPQLQKDEIAQSGPEALVKEIENFLGNTEIIETNDPQVFYQRVQKFIDSKEKVAGRRRAANTAKPEERSHWPLIKVVRIYVKSLALSTGAVIVDLPGVQDANAARATVAENYMQLCTGLWIVAPIIRAVDDKTAKELLGDSFKRQLKMDGNFSSITFICSKADDISIVEASESLDTDGKIDTLRVGLKVYEAVISQFQEEIVDLQTTKTDYGEQMSEYDEKIEFYEDVRIEVVQGCDGKEKRKNSGELATERVQKRPKTNCSTRHDSLTIEGEISSYDDSDISFEVTTQSSKEKEPLTHEDIASKLDCLKAKKKEARHARLKITGQLKALQKRKKDIQDGIKIIKAKIHWECINARNRYSKSAIQEDFAAGIRELDQEIAVEEDEDNFDSSVELRNYDEVAKSLKVFCVSSRGYQKLRGRLGGDAPIPGFTSVAQTEIPALQDHCENLTVVGRTAACNRFVPSLNKLLRSLTAWSDPNSAASPNVTREQKEKETEILNESLEDLRNRFKELSVSTKVSLSEELGEVILDKFPPAEESARNEADKTCERWFRPVNRDDRSAGGFHYNTFQAICWRDGRFHGLHGQHDFNAQLAEPILKHTASNWERMFTYSFPSMIANYSAECNSILKEFHYNMSTNSQISAASTTKLAILGQDLDNYSLIIANKLASIKASIMDKQKNINRKFKLNVRVEMRGAYNRCASESGSGSGSFGRVKKIMSQHVERQKGTMFRNSCGLVKVELKELLTATHEDMTNLFEEIYLIVRQDYKVALGGFDPCGEENQIAADNYNPRANILRIIRTAEAGFVEALMNKTTVSTTTDFNETRLTDLIKGIQNQPVDSIIKSEHGGQYPVGTVLGEVAENESSIEDLKRIALDE